MPLSDELNPEIFAGLAMRGFKRRLLALTAFAYSFDDEAKEVGDSVKVKNIPKFATDAVKTVAPGEKPNYKQGKPNANSIKFDLDGHKYVPIELTDVEAANNSAAQLEEFSDEQGAALAEQVFEDVFSLIKPSNFASHDAIESSDTAVDSDEIKAMRKVLAGRGANLEKCSAILDSNYYTELLGDDNLGKSTEKLSGFSFKDYHEIPQLPENGERVVGVVTHPSALAVALRYLKPTKPDEYIAAFPVTDPDTGMVFGYREGYDTSDGTWFCSLEAVYGKAIANTLAAAFLQRPAA